MSDLEIVQGESSKAYEWAIQAGPIIWQNKEPRLLQLQRDQSARRIIAGITDDEKLSLLVITAKDSLFYGPLLAEVPSIVSAILAQQRDLKLTAAINLDGGTASAFLTPTLQLKELQPIGSYLCSR